MPTVYTDEGESYTVDRIRGTEAALPDRIGWGTGGATAAAKGQTALVAEASEARALATLSKPAADTLRAVGTLTADGTKTISEAALLTAIKPGGRMIIRADFAGVPMVLNDAIEFTFDLQFA